MVLIKEIYSKIRAAVKAGATMGDIFWIVRGVIEGDIMSALIFIVGLEAVVRKAGNDESAPVIGNIPVPKVGFADMEKVQVRFDTVSHSLKRRGLKFSAGKGKCKLIHGGPALHTQMPTSEDIDNLKLAKVQMQILRSAPIREPSWEKAARSKLRFELHHSP